MKALRYKRFLRVVEGLRENGFDMTGSVDFAINVVEENNEARKLTPEEKAIKAGLVQAENVYRGYNLTRDEIGFHAARIGAGGPLANPSIHASEEEGVRMGVDLSLSLQNGGLRLVPFEYGGEVLGMNAAGLDFSMDNVPPSPGPNKEWFVKLIESYKQYNICRFEDLFYAVPIGIGEVNLTKAADRKREGVIPALSLNHAKSLVDLVTA